MYTNNKAFRLNPKCLSTSKKGPMEYSYTLLNISKKCTLLIMKTMVRVTVCYDLESEATKLVKVKAHVRLYKNKVVIVRSHYRRVWIRK